MLCKPIPEGLQEAHIVHIPSDDLKNILASLRVAAATIWGELILTTQRQNWRRRPPNLLLRSGLHRGGPNVSVPATGSGTFALATSGGIGSFGRINPHVDTR